MAFVVVAFPDEGGVAVVPSGWCINDSKCHWPPYKSSLRIDKAVKSAEVPDADSWGTHAIRIFSKTDSYERARVLMARAELTSDIQSDIDEVTRIKRKRKANKRYVSSSESELQSDDDDDPRPPTPPTAKDIVTPRTSRPLQIVPSPTQSIAGSSSSSMNPDTMSTIKAMHRVNLTMLAELKSELQAVKQQVKNNTQLLRAMTATNREEPLYELPDDVVLPAKTNDDLETIEEYLKTDKAFEKHLVQSLSVLGGQSLAEIVKRTMKELISNVIACGFNWTGQGHKKAFKDLKLRAVLEKSIRRNAATSSATCADIQRQVSHFLRGAADREGGRKARQRPTAAAPPSLSSPPASPASEAE